MDAENARRAEEARAANEAAAKARAAEDGFGETKVDGVPPVEPERVTGVGNLRTVSERARVVWVVSDVREYLRHLLSLNVDLPAEIIEAAEKAARRRAVEAPGVEKRTERQAA